MIYLNYLLEATNGILAYPGKQSHFDAFSHDTRQLIPGEMFVAVRGEHGDGHDYLLDAVQRGAVGLLLEARVLAALAEETRAVLERAGVATIAVADTRIALQQYARFILERWHPIVIAVTGSTGKTSTKEAIASVLSSGFATFRSWQNYNDLLGLPLSLGRLEERHEYAVLELSCDHPGEISDLCRITRPHIGVLTNISPAQLRYFRTVERLASELGTLLTSLPQDGMAIVNGARLLSDTHNAVPAAVMAGLETLKALPAGRRIAILGDMFRLGHFEEEAHRMIGRKAASCVDYLILRGEYAAMVAASAQQAGLSVEQIIITSTHEDAARAACQIIEAPEKQRATLHNATLPADAILIKGSEEARMERVTELLMAQPALAPEQLVRQTPGWKQIVVMRAERPTWVEIDLSAIANNTRQIKAMVGPQVRVLASLKADAYGHGALKVARTVLHNGSSMLWVATVSEATPLREAGINAPILVFGYVPPWQMREAVRLGLTVTLYAIESAQALAPGAIALRPTVKVPVKVDSGMGRLGIRAEQVEEVLALLREILALPGLELEGIFTHFAMADTQDLTHARMQLARFQSVLHV